MNSKLNFIENRYQLFACIKETGKIPDFITIEELRNRLEALEPGEMISVQVTEDRE